MFNQEYEMKFDEINAEVELPVVQSGSNMSHYTGFGCGPVPSVFASCTC